MNFRYCAMTENIRAMFLVLSITRHVAGTITRLPHDSGDIDADIAHRVRSPKRDAMPAAMNRTARRVVGRSVRVADLRHDVRGPAAGCHADPASDDD